MNKVGGLWIVINLSNINISNNIGFLFSLSQMSLKYSIDIHSLPTITRSVCHTWLGICLLIIDCEVMQGMSCTQIGRTVVSQRIQNVVVFVL